MNIAGNIKKRLIRDGVIRWVVILLSVVAGIPLFSIVFELVVKGVPQLSIPFFTKTSPTAFDAIMAAQSGETIVGGIANGIIGTLLMVLMASAIAIPVGVAVGAYLSENGKSVFSNIVRFIADLLQGMPSIVIGIVVYIAIVVPMKNYSAIAGSLSLAVMMMPLIVRSTEETLNLLPVSLKESALALGTSYRATLMKILLPAAFKGIFAGILLSLSRIIGETAPLMFTALGSTMIQWNIAKPSSAIPLLVWEFYNDPNLQAMVWSASLFLLLLAFALNIIANKK